MLGLCEKLTISTSWLCKYKDIFGKPGQGIHSTRIFGYAFYDIVFTIIFSFMITYLNVFKFKNKSITFWVVLTSLLILGTLLHILFCVDTAFVILLKSHLC